MLREKVAMIFAHGFTNLKLYLQFGLPSETEEDLRDLVRLVADCRELALAAAKSTGKMATVVPSVNAFIPKPHTPYENEPLASEEDLKRKSEFLMKAFAPMSNVRFRAMPVSEAKWEAYLAKMDESAAEILERGADGVPVRRLLKDFAPQIGAVVRPTAPPPGAGKPVNAWDFISKR
jgi:radical SAM superfamily enzyme YgiQ (UPF0313 family)